MENNNRTQSTIYESFKLPTNIIKSNELQPDKVFLHCNSPFLTVSDIKKMQQNITNHPQPSCNCSNLMCQQQDDTLEDSNYSQEQIPLNVYPEPTLVETLDKLNLFGYNVS